MKPKRQISKAIAVKGSILTVIPKSFLPQLGIDGNTYLEHTLTSEGMVTRAIRLPSDAAEHVKSGLETE